MNARGKLKNVIIKCVAVGDGGNGKTCLYIRFARNQFPEEYIPTVFDNYAEDMDINGTNVSLGLWDTGGGEDYHRLRPLSYPETDFFLICSAIDDRNHLRCVEEEWYPELVKYCPKALMYLVGTKMDMRTKIANGLPKNSAVTYQEGSDLAKKLGLAGYMECSALTGEGVREMFSNAVEEALNNRILNKKKKLKCLIL